MFVDNGGSLVLVDVTGEDNGEYHCQANKSDAIVNTLSYTLMVLEPTGYTEGKLLVCHSECLL